jgi:hypothetical protein
MQMRTTFGYILEGRSYLVVYKTSFLSDTHDLFDAQYSKRRVFDVQQKFIDYVAGCWANGVSFDQGLVRFRERLQEHRTDFDDILVTTSQNVVACGNGHFMTELFLRLKNEDTNLYRVFLYSVLKGV